MQSPIVLYDGVCGLCNRLVQFVLRRDPRGFFRFASLQSAPAGRVLARHGGNAADRDTVYVVVNYELADELLLARSDAVIFVLRHLRAAGHGPAGRDLRADAIASSSSSSHLAFWRVAGIVLRVIPRPLRDWGYGVVARHRYRWFGRFEKCPLPTEETRVRFMDV